MSHELIFDTALTLGSIRTHDINDLNKKFHSNSLIYISNENCASFKPYCSLTNIDAVYIIAIANKFRRRV